MKTVLNKLTLLTFLIILLSIFSIGSTVKAWDQSLPWDQQASGCVVTSTQNVKSELYLGNASSVPTYINQTYPNAAYYTLQPIKDNIIGMKVLEFKSFEVPAKDNTYSKTLAGKNLFFEVQLLSILTNNNSVTATSSDVVNVVISLYTDCTMITSHTTKSVATTQSIWDPTTVTFLTLGLVAVLGIGSLIGYNSYTKKRTEKINKNITEKNKEFESKKLKSLKDTLDEVVQTDKPGSGSETKKVSKSMRRRR